MACLAPEFGPWWITAQWFTRWSKRGVWQRFFSRVSRKDPALGMVFLDGTIIRAHHKAAGTAKKEDTQEAREIVKLLAAHVEALLPRPATYS
ncbi:hypothetical protein [Saccharibacter floricola]|uniref:Transposase n=1 Tax=Saccharibacter floricola DSM 15669 TaxID=1123227 RepID=A0ABQ0NZ58_9PROT|nr:hypothetical protein [Saccharibacter floricola]GBQ07131.1 transposase [Saccharibacter floricola DSM 15669]